MKAPKRQKRLVATVPPLLITPDEKSGGNRYLRSRLVGLGRNGHYGAVPISTRTVRFQRDQPGESIAGDDGFLSELKPLLVDRKGAGRILAISRRVLDGLVENGELVPVRLTGRVVRFRVAELEEFVRQRVGWNRSKLRRHRRAARNRALAMDDGMRKHTRPRHGDKT